VPLLSIEGLSYTYEGAPRPALEDISLALEPGDYLAVVGSNGSGKSTLLRLMDGLLRPGSGRVLVDGADSSEGSAARAVRSALALVFQSPQDQLVASVVEEDVAFGPENLGLPRDEIGRRVESALAAVGLSGERRSPVRSLSAGQQQRLALAGALAMEPRCIAFDEATSMLDPHARAEVLDLLDGLSARGAALVHATHDMAEAARAGRVIALEEGRIVYDGSPAGLFSLIASGQGGPVLARLELPPSWELALALGMEGLTAESAAGIAARIAGAWKAAPGMPPLHTAVGEPDNPSRGADAREAFRLEQVSFSYLRGTTGERRALQGVSMSVPEGSLVALVGKTGSGKSTLLQLMDALAFPFSGRVTSLGADTGARGADLRAIRTRAPLSVQRPESALFERYAGDDVAFGPRNLGLSGQALVERVRAAMETAGLPFTAFRDRKTRSLSGGEKRKLAIAGVLALQPLALLLDEPCSALDPASRKAMSALARSFALRAGASDGRTVVMATHSMEEAAAADLVAVIAEGGLAAFGTPGEIFYDHFEPAWGIGRPFACEAAIELGRLGVEVPGQPLDIPALAAALGAGHEARVAGRLS